jgi:serine/threonine-protein kinase
VAVPRSRGLVVGGAAALVLLGAGVLWWSAPASSSTPSPAPAQQEAPPAPARTSAEPAKRSPPAASDTAKRPAPATSETAKRPPPAAPAPEEPRPSPAPSTARRPLPEQLPGIEEVHKLIRAKRRDSALAALKKLATQYPASAYVRFLEGNVDFDNLRWVDGVAAYRAALRNDAAYRHEPTVIQNAIRCLVSDRYHGTCVDFIRKDLGEAAVPYLEEASRSDPMANVRARAAWLLRKR